LTRNPDTGRINVGCYRQMLHGPRRVGLYCSPGKHGLIDREAWWARGKPCEVVAAYGIGPVLFMLAAQGFGIKVSEPDVAGGLRGGVWGDAAGVGGGGNWGPAGSPPTPSLSSRDFCNRATVKRKARSASSPATTVASARRSG